MTNERIEESFAQEQTERRFRDAQDSVLTMFDELNLGWTHDDILSYLEGWPTWKSFKQARLDGKVFGAILTIAVLCVQQERNRQLDNSW